MTRFRFRENARWYALGLGLAGALVLLAILQYRSNRQLRDVLQTQMRATLQGSLMNVRFGLEQELSPICNTLSPPPNPQENNLESYPREFAQWRGTAVHPALVEDIFIYQRAGHPQPGLLQIQPDGNKFEAVDWPADFIPLHGKLDQMSGADSPFSSWQIEENIPALVHPIRGPEKQVILSFLIVQLNLQELSHHILPELAQRYLGSNGHLDYQLALINRNTDGSLVYSSDAGFRTRDDHNSDAQLNVFGPPISLGNGGLPPGSFSSAAHVAERPPDSRDELGPSHSGGPGAFPTMRIGGPPPLRREPGPLMLQTIRYSPSDRGWTIIARHRKGSVEAAVTAVYHRNLAVSFGALAVLAGTIAMVMMTTRRARRLAQLQMDFVASVSHELRTPLTGIVSAAQNVADGLVDNKERAMRYGAAILSQGQQLSELIEQILLFSATEKGRYNYHFQWVDIAEVIEASLRGAGGLIREVHVEQTIAPDLPQVWGDFKALTQCLQNLIANSMKYGGEGRWIGIRASLATAPTSGREILITVEDKGLGISPEDLKNIFEPFYRSPAVTSAQIHGSGLGLAIVKSIVEAMDGSLTVKSELGRGSSFSVHLPAGKKSAPGEDASESAQSADNR